MAHKKGVGSTKNGRESHSKRLGVKLFGGEIAIAGNIIIRQRGTKYHPGLNVGIGKDHTIFAMTDGVVEFRTKKNDRTFVNIIPFEDEVAEVLTETAAATVSESKLEKEVQPSSIAEELSTDETSETEEANPSAE